MKHFTLVIAFFLLLYLSFFEACAQYDHREIETTWEAFISVWESLDAKGCASFYWEDGLNVPPQLPENRGRVAIEAFYDGLFSQHEASRYVHKTHSLEPIGDQLLEYGEFAVDWVTKDGNEWQYQARTMVYWKKDKEGHWKIKYLIFNQAP
ncbi:MAG: YybH family protein [Cecembia sp.]